MPVFVREVTTYKRHIVGKPQKQEGDRQEGVRPILALYQWWKDLRKTSWISIVRTCAKQPVIILLYFNITFLYSRLRGVKHFIHNKDLISYEAESIHVYLVLYTKGTSLSVKVSALGRVHCKDNYCMPKRGQRCGEVELKLVPWAVLVLQCPILHTNY